MKIRKIILLTALVVVIGGLAYVSTTDINIKQSTVTKEIPNDRFYKDE